MAEPQKSLKDAARLVADGARTFHYFIQYAQNLMTQAFDPETKEVKRPLRYSESDAPVIRASISHSVASQTAEALKDARGMISKGLSVLFSIVQQLDLLAGTDPSTPLEDIMYRIQERTPKDHPELREALSALVPAFKEDDAAILEIQSLANLLAQRIAGKELAVEAFHLKEQKRLADLEAKEFGPLVPGGTA